MADLREAPRTRARMQHDLQVRTAGQSLLLLGIEGCTGITP
jgi:hypothetical protein